MTGPRVVVGMSGGVDSSVAAALLVERGYEVVGVTMRLWTETRPEAMQGHQQCCSVEDIDDARRVAGQLGIRHYVMNFEDEFRERVVEDFIAEYAAGRTPNPCIRCNEHIKYRALLDRLDGLGAEYLATGHYARVIHDSRSFPGRTIHDSELPTADCRLPIGEPQGCSEGPRPALTPGPSPAAAGEGSPRVARTEDFGLSECRGAGVPECPDSALTPDPSPAAAGEGSAPTRDFAQQSALSTLHHRLLRAIDGSKDQSYVLYMLGQEQLARLILPIGELTKAEVREHARRLGLDTAEKPDSVEICFVPGNDYRAFVGERLAQQPGEMRDAATGEVLGEHRGLAGYTIGQRKGLGIAVGEPRFVTAIDAAANVVVVGPEEALFADTVEVAGVSWVAGRSPETPACIEAKARYRAEPAPARLESVDGDGAIVRFDRRQRALTPGQAIVFYDGEDVLGGGTIRRVR